MDEDARATQLQYSEHSPYLWRRMAQRSFLLSAVLENVNPDLSDSEFIEREETMEPTTPGFLGSDAGDEMTPMGGQDDDDEGDEGEESNGDQETCTIAGVVAR